jgi:hypothetical protein
MKGSFENPVSEIDLYELSALKLTRMFVIIYKYCSAVQ